MNTINCIRARRSIRKFKSKRIPENLLLSIIDAGRWAPSASNLNPIKYIIIEDADVRKKIASATYNPDVIKSAPVVVAVCSSTGLIQRNFGKKGDLYEIQGTAVATQNIMLAAREFGLGSCWIAISIESRLRRLLQIPDGFAVHNLLALGYPDHSPRVPAKPDINAITYFDTWGLKAKDQVKRIKDKTLPLLENPKVKKLKRKAIKTKDKLKKKITSKTKKR